MCKVNFASVFSWCILFLFFGFTMETEAQSYLKENLWDNHRFRISTNRMNVPIGLLKNLSSPMVAGGSSTADGIDLYSGTNRVCIPLYTANARGFSIPLSIGYVASGVKLDQISGPIGLGWSLNAGGCIRRMIKGLPDDFCGLTGTNNSLYEVGWIKENDIYCQLPVLNIDTAISQEISIYSPFGDKRGGLRHLLGKNINSTVSEGVVHDLEPDQYIIDCPYLGGSFVFSTQRDPITHKPLIRSIGQTNMKFDYTLSTLSEGERITAFTITDEAGNKFFFGTDIEIYTTNFYSVFVNNTQNNDNRPFYLNGNFAFVSSIDHIYNNAWFLQKIETILGDEISFTYTKEIYGADPSYVDFIRGQSAIPPPLNPYKRYMSKYYSSNLQMLDFIETYRISKISARSFVIDFLAFNNREDMNYIPTSSPCKRIDRIMVYNKFGPNNNDVVLTRQFDFDFEYMESNSNPSGFGPPDYASFMGANKRLCLKKLTESTKFKAFSPYVFSYEEGILPNRFRYAADIYGYYNGQLNNQTDIPTISIYLADFEYNDRFWPITLPNLQPDYTLAGANREFNADYAKIGLLNSITYPSGAVISYDYEPHAFSYKTQNITGAGFRLKAKTTKENGITLSMDQYLYEGGRALGFPAYGYYDPCIDYPTNYPQEYWNSSYVRSGVNISNSGGSIGYDKVKVTTNANGGFTEYEFENTPTLDSPISQVLPESYYTPGPESLPDYVSLIPQSGSLDDFNRFSELDVPNNFPDHILTTFPYPYRNHVNADWFRGRVKKIKVYDNNYNMVKQTEYSYQERYPGATSFGNLTDQEIIYGVKTAFIENESNSGSEPVAVATKYAIYTGVASLLGSMKTTQYNANGYIESQTDYTYNEVGQPETTSTTNSDGTIFQQRSTWLYDLFNAREHPESSNYYLPDGILYQMAYQNQANTLIEQVNELILGGETFVTGGNLNTYKEAAIINGKTKFLTDKTYVLPTDVLIPANQSSTGHFSYPGISSGQNPAFQFDSRYDPVSTFDAYDAVGRLIESHPTNDNKNVILWDNYLDQMHASVINAQRNECEYSGFEFGRPSSHSNLMFAQCVKSDQNNMPFSGNYQLKISSGGGFQQYLDFSQDKPANNGYKVSAWVKGGGDVIMYLHAKDVNTNLLSKSVANPSSNNEWHLLTLSFTKEEISQLTYNAITVEVLNNSTSDIYVDEVKCYPADAIFSSQSYDERNNLISSVTKNDLSSSIEYDDVGRTSTVRDFENNILATSSYNSSNPANFSVCDCDDTGTTTIIGKYEVNETLTITCNSLDVPDATFKYSKDSESYADCNGQLTLSFSTAGNHTLRMKVTINGTEYVFLRNVIIY